MASEGDIKFVDTKTPHPKLSSEFSSFFLEKPEKRAAVDRSYWLVKDEAYNSRKAEGKAQQYLIEFLLSECQYKNLSNFPT